ncbi:MAG TPA: ferritin-like domain-containing protein [Pirellulales bacterium]|jgi:ferritin-like metal-binding protein YciE|nr:ferritin-like domain-containing protein [Pirellulales bacterium]
MKGTSWFSKMTGMSMKLENLNDLLVAQLEDLYSAEIQLIDALPKMEQAAQSAELKTAFRNHLAETQRQKQRMERIFELIGHSPQKETCEAMQGLISEGEEIINAEGDPEVKDAALIAAGQRVEHYEMAGYGCARTFAHRLGHHEAGELLQETLNEEGNADKLLSQIAERSVNLHAARS